MRETLNKTLAEWRWGKGYTWYPPNEPYSSDEPDFIHSLDSCFEHLVPKLVEDGKWIRLEVISGEIECVVEIRDWRNILYAESSPEDTPALALCKAIEKLVDAQETN